MQNVRPFEALCTVCYICHIQYASVAHLLILKGTDRLFPLEGRRNGLSHSSHEYNKRTTGITKEDVSSSKVEKITNKEESLSRESLTYIKKPSRLVNDRVIFCYFKKQHFLPANIHIEKSPTTFGNQEDEAEKSLLYHFRNISQVRGGALSQLHRRKKRKIVQHWEEWISFSPPLERSQLEDLSRGVGRMRATHSDCEILEEEMVINPTGYSISSTSA